jgi:hypothetical protein
VGDAVSLVVVFLSERVVRVEVVDSLGAAMIVVL